MRVVGLRLESLLRKEPTELKRALAYLIFTILFLSLTVPGLAQESSWTEVRQRLLAPNGYSLLCDYTGPEGQYYFSYIVQGDGKKILTEILEGSSRGAGTRIYFNPSLDKENVHMQTRMFRLRRSLQARDIKDSPLHKPLFVHLLEEIGELEPRRVTSSKEGDTVFLFGDPESQHEYLVVDREGNPTLLKRMMADKQVNCLTFHQLEWGEQPINWKE